MPAKRKVNAIDKGLEHAATNELIEAFESDDDEVHVQHPFMILDEVAITELGAPDSFREGGLFDWDASGIKPGREESNVSARMGAIITLHLRGAPLEERRTAMRRLWEDCYNQAACKQLAIFFCDLRMVPSGVESK